MAGGKTFVTSAWAEPDRLRVRGLVNYTDGVTEICTDDLTLGDRELRAVLARTAGGSAEDVVAAVERRALELQGSARRDDIALVAIRACP
jgi:serine phosphatase RsbU (regulator of sigma subunit)